MLCKIADLIIDVPEAGGLAPRCRDYLIRGEYSPDIVIHQERYNKKYYAENISDEQLAYLESARQFAVGLIRYNGFYLHATAIELNGFAYLFSGNSRVGKSTHARQWQSFFGDSINVINDDKPAIRRMGETWYAYGTPWCGKDGINQNKKVPIAGICFLKQAKHNVIKRLDKEDALSYLLGQTIRRFSNVENLDQLLDSLGKLIREVPVFMLENKPEPQAAAISYEAMFAAMKESNL